MYDKKFYILLNYVLADEGGYSNDSDDRGGETNLGITQTALNEYTRTRHLPSKSVKNMTKDLATKIYYEDYYIKSGADKQKDIRDAYILFDTAVQNGALSAKQMFKRADENFYKLIEIRKQHYYNQVHKDYSQRKFLKGWLNRLNKIEQRADKLIKEAEFSNIYSSNQKTPFDDDYKGVLNKVENLPNKEKEYLKNKYEYILNKNNEKSNIANINSSSNQDKKIYNFSDEIRSKYKKMLNERNSKIKFKKHSNVYGEHWVTINGNHVLINS
ncbi:MAG: hypothetical protein K6C94_05145 [Candidatus Gastranaerophilales bacterium]|nr:hypothetical protein [Candidatus Gastranaerophilales bacterium]